MSKGDQVKIMWNFQGSLFLALEFPRDLTQFCGISRGGAFFVWNSQRLIKKKKNSRGVFKKVCPQPLCLFFSGIVH